MGGGVGLTNAGELFEAECWDEPPSDVAGEREDVEFGSCGGLLAFSISLAHLEQMILRNVDFRA